jgi:hypothetical protein
MRMAHAVADQEGFEITIVVTDWRLRLSLQQPAQRQAEDRGRARYFSATCNVHTKSFLVGEFIDYSVAIFSMKSFCNISGLAEPREAFIP